MGVTQLQHAVLQVLNNITAIDGRINNLVYNQVIDTERHHYQLVVTGWQLRQHIHGIVAHMDIKDGLICVEEDGTDFGIATELEWLGVPTSQIVLPRHNAPVTSALTEALKR